jgi:hypothetical protein
MDDGRNDWIGNVDRPNLPEEFPLGLKSDVAAEMLRRLDIPYVALNPGASYRGFHDSLVNYLGNRAPQMIVCLHEDHVVAVAHGYAKATDKNKLALQGLLPDVKCGADFKTSLQRQYDLFGRVTSAANLKQ